MRVPAIVAAGAFVIGGCASDPERDQRMTRALQQLEGADYAATERCLSTFEYDQVEVLDQQHLLFESNTGQELWLNTLRTACPGLREDDVLAFEMTGNRLCSLDTATVMERFLFWQRTGPTCSLGEFQQLTEGQAELVREALES